MSKVQPTKSEFIEYLAQIKEVYLDDGSIVGVFATKDNIKLSTPDAQSSRNGLITYQTISSYYDYCLGIVGMPTAVNLWLIKVVKALIEEATKLKTLKLMAIKDERDAALRESEALRVSIEKMGNAYNGEMSIKYKSSEDTKQGIDRILGAAPLAGVKLAKNEPLRDDEKAQTNTGNNTSEEKSNHAAESVRPESKEEGISNANGQSTNVDTNNIAPKTKKTRRTLDDVFIPVFHAMLETFGFSIDSKASRKSSINQEIISSFINRFNDSESRHNKAKVQLAAQFRARSSEKSASSIFYNIIVFILVAVVVVTCYKAYSTFTDGNEIETAFNKVVATSNDISKMTVASEAWWKIRQTKILEFILLKIGILTPLFYFIYFFNKKSDNNRLLSERYARCAMILENLEEYTAKFTKAEEFRVMVAQNLFTLSDLEASKDDKEEIAKVVELISSMKKITDK